MNRSDVICYMFHNGQQICNGEHNICQMMTLKINGSQYEIREKHCNIDSLDKYLLILECSYIWTF